jgi:sugar lactone lactonase YvrE
MSIEVVVDADCACGEGPLWYNGKFMWIDIVKKHLSILDPANPPHVTATFDQPVTAVLPIDGSTNEVILCLGRSIVRYHLEVSLLRADQMKLL